MKNSWAKAERNESRMPMMQYAKRAIDLWLSVSLLILLLPLLSLASAFIYFTELGPVFFVQDRLGLDGRLFRFCKLRTMSQDRDENGNLLPDRLRIKPWGAFLRRTSLDELPQLWLVISGKMSLVGPRPLLPRYWAYFTEKEKLRFKVLPGITGLAQINGRNTASWNKRLAYDIEYVKGWSIFLDVKIMIRTVLNVVYSRGIVVDANEIMDDLDTERLRKKASS